MKRLYAGVGSREIPYREGFVIGKVANKLSANGFTLRSGKARGADTIFENNHDGPMELFTKSSRIPDRAYEIAAQHCIGFETYGDYVKALMARNCLIFLGQELDDPVEFSVVWSLANPEDYGGSAMGMRLCTTYGIPFYNLRIEGTLDRLRLMLIDKYGVEFKPKAM